MTTGFETALCRLAYKHGTDKCPQIRHSYTPLYFRLLNHKRQTVKKVLEIGIGCPDTMIDTPGYRTGASLRMWREFFPNATIYGVDVVPETIFQEERISTFLCDARDQEQLVELIDTIGSDIDVVIDDASHWRKDQIDTCLFLMPLLNKGVYYFIEDLEHPRILLRDLGALYDCLLFEGTNHKRSDKMILVRHK